MSKKDSNTEELIFDKNALDESIYDDILYMLEQEDYEDILQIFEKVHISDTVNIIETIGFEPRRQILNLFSKEFYVELMEWIPKYLVHEVIDIKGIDFIISIIQENKDIDFAYSIVKDLDHHDKHLILDSISLYKRKATEKKFNYPKDSAGRLMQSSFIRVLSNWSVAQCIRYIKEFKKSNTEDFSDTLYDIFIVDDKGVALGSVSLSKLFTAKEDENILEISNDNFKAIHTHMDQEEVALVFRSRGFVSAAVIDNSGVLVGSITIDDIIDVIYQETEEDLLLLSGIQGDSSSNKYKTIFYSAQKRLKWLSFNLVEALAIPFIVTIFSGVLSKNVILAALIQFVVALGGNAGMQSLTVTLRGLTLKLITKTNVLRQVGKEFGIACINGSLLGLIGILWGSFWGNGIMIGLIAFMAVFINVILGTTFGTMYPIILKKFKIDPAVASAVCVTTSTDIVGFFLVLLIATILL